LDGFFHRHHVTCDLEGCIDRPRIDYRLCSVFRSVVYRRHIELGVAVAPILSSASLKVEDLEEGREKTSVKIPFMMKV
jgi:hypothetical protein